MCNTNNDEVIYNPSVVELHRAFRDDRCEVWNVDVGGNHYKSTGNLYLGDSSLKTVYIKRKPKIVAKYGDFEFTADELPQKEIINGTAYYHINASGVVIKSSWWYDNADLKRAANKNVFLTEQAAEKWQQMLLSFQNNILKGTF